MDERSSFFLETVDDTRKAKVFRTVRASDGLQRAKLFWYHLLGDFSSELETKFWTALVQWQRMVYHETNLLEKPSILGGGCLCARSAALSNRLMVQRRFNRIRGASPQAPHCILAIGSVPKEQASAARANYRQRPINKYAERWRVRYASVQEICLTLYLCASRHAPVSKSARRCRTRNPVCR